MPVTLSKTQLNARSLRSKQTDTEQHLWNAIRKEQLGVKFRRQHAIPPYIADFVCVELKLIIELDGSQHQEQQTYDEKREKFLKALGYQVLRYWNNEVFENLSGVLTDIKSHIDDRTPP